MTPRSSAPRLFSRISFGDRKPQKRNGLAIFDGA
jgi:hypothetical protein